MATLETFKTLQKDASDRSYPHDNTKLRREHADYARSLIARLREAGADVVAANKAEGQGAGGPSFSASKTTISQIISAVRKVERYISQQEARHEAGLLVTLLHGAGRHLLAQAFVKLYFEMKNHYANVEAGRVTREGEIVIEDGTDVEDVRDQGTAVVEAFLSAAPDVED